MNSEKSRNTTSGSSSVTNHRGRQQPVCKQQMSGKGKFLFPLEFISMKMSSILRKSFSHEMGDTDT